MDNAISSLDFAISASAYCHFALIRRLRDFQNQSPTKKAGRSLPSWSRDEDYFEAAADAAAGMEADAEAAAFLAFLAFLALGAEAEADAEAAAGAEAMAEAEAEAEGAAAKAALANRETNRAAMILDIFIFLLW